jgi:hypothetical protein
MERTDSPTVLVRATDHCRIKLDHMRRIISFMHISLDGFVAGPNGEMNRIKVDEEIFDHVSKRISEGVTV